jgi:hypothetical protein
MEPICLFTNPEDIEALPDRKTLLISQMGKSMKHPDPGSLVFFDSVTRKVRPAVADSSDHNLEAADNWGAPDCPGAPGATLAPHGISLKQRADQRWQLAVVNHGGRESIDMYELINAGEQTRLEWRGCVVPDPEVFFNDVVLLKNGGFVASHMFDKRSPHVLGLRTGVFKAMLGMDTGYVLAWQRDSGFRILEESHGAFINGVELSADERHVFANVYFGKELRKLDLQTGEKVGSAAIAKADNLAWDKQGHLLNIAHTGTLQTLLACMKQPGQTCALGYTVYRINPDTMASEILFVHEGSPMGAATVARQLDDWLYLGSYTGNRIVRMLYPTH